MAHVATITIDHTKVPGDLTDYVGLIVPDGSAGYSALYALCLEGGGDIRLFKSDDTTELAREIVTFSVTDETGEIHYKYSGTLSSSVDTDIHVYADGSSADYAVGATYGRNNVWADYNGVLHNGGTTDSTGNSASYSANGGVTVGGLSSPTGKATNFDGSNDSVTNASSTGYGGHTAYSFQAWLYPNDITSRQGILLNSNAIDAAGETWALENNSSGGRMRFTNSDNFNNIFNLIETPGNGTLTANEWQQVICVRDGGNGNIYRNGTSSISTTSGLTTATSVGNGNFAIGKFGLGNFLYYDGGIGEFRYRDSALSANWITTEYNNQNSYSTFYSVAAVAGGSAAQAARRGAVMMM